MSMPTAGDGDVGEEEEDESFFILSSKLQPVARVHASASETGSQVVRIESLQGAGRAS